MQAWGCLADRLLQLAWEPHRLALDLVQLAQDLDVAQLVEVELPLLLRCADLELQVCHLQSATVNSVPELADTASTTFAIAWLIHRCFLHLLRHAYLQLQVACEGSIAVWTPA